MGGDGRAETHAMTALLKLALGLGLALGAAGLASAEMYKDYDLGKGVSQVTLVNVDPNHLDDYLTGLKKSEAPGFEILKRRGLISGWYVTVRDGWSKDVPNVAIVVNFVNDAALAPDSARDQAIEREMLAVMPDAEGKAMVANYEKYRTFTDIGTWRNVDYK